MTNLTHNKMWLKSEILRIANKYHITDGFPAIVDALDAFFGELEQRRLHPKVGDITDPMGEKVFIGIDAVLGEEAAE